MIRQKQYYSAAIELDYGLDQLTPNSGDLPNVKNSIFPIDFRSLIFENINMKYLKKIKWTYFAVM